MDADNRINRIHERSLRIVYRDSTSSFEALLNKDNYFTQEYIEDIEYEMIVNKKDNRNIHNLIPILFEHTSSLLSTINGSFISYLHKDIIEEFKNQYNHLQNVYSQEKVNKHIIQTSDLLISEDELRKIVNDNYFYLASDYTNSKTLKTSYKPIP